MSLTGCGDDSTAAPGSTQLEATIVTATSATMDSSHPTTEPPGEHSILEDRELSADDFTNLAAMTPVDGFFVDNRLGHLDDALAVAARERPGPYPVGTVIQLFPTEAMVKRAQGFDPASGDWEFFLLEVSDAGTEIISRGGAEVVNGFGVSCVSCHGQAASASDFVCHGDDSCPPLTLDPDGVRAIQATDPRPTTAQPVS